MTIDAIDMTKQLGEITKGVDATVADDAIALAAELLIGEARRRAPLEFGKLSGSEYVEDPKNKTIFFGFNSPYASVMNYGWKSKYIYPKTAKRLFVPISRRAKRAGSRSSSPHGLKYGTDYLLLKRVGPMPAPMKGRKKGPNFYFTSALDDKRDAATKVVASAFDKSIEGALI